MEKKKTSKKKRDERGIQTLFRTTSHNHYTLNEMVDRKASIMITVNSIILSLLIGGLLPLDQESTPHAAAFSLGTAAFISIVFTIISITPNKTQGKFTREDVRLKKGNLLYFGNFTRISYPEYEVAMKQQLNDSEYLYTSLIKDLYYLGKVLNFKYLFIRISLFVFLTGMVVSFFLAFILPPTSLSAVF